MYNNNNNIHSILYRTIENRTIRSRTIMILRHAYDEQGFNNDG